MSKAFRAYNLDQQLLLPPSLHDWLPEGHLARFVVDVVAQLELGEIYQAYQEEDGRGMAAYHPAMMVSLLLYGYCLGVVSSRKLERATYEDVGFRYVSGDQHPDHDTIASFRQRHLPSLARLFGQGLRLCARAGLVKLGHVALDGTKIKANASKHKAMSYGRMEEAEKELQEQIEQLLAQAQATDEEEDRRYGKGQRGDELPAELARRESRLQKIQEAKAALEQEARERAEQKRAEVEAELERRRQQEQETGKKVSGKPPQAPDPEQAKPEAKAQRNFTDPESRIMKDGATKGFEQAYNAQIAVDSTAQVIVAAAVTQDPNDKQQLAPMLEQVEKNTGVKPAQATADAGYFSEAQIGDQRVAGIELYVAPDRQKHGSAVESVSAEGVAGGESIGPVIDQMRQKIRSPEGQAVYGRRKAVVEPVFGQIKERRAFRRFLFRGLSKVRAEWQIICLTHNLLKLFRSGWSPAAT